MANTFVLGGSPLGLIGVRSRPTADGMSTFNGGDSRNVNVSSYNLGRKQSTNIVVDGKPVESTVSLFTGDAIPNFWANISKAGTDGDTTGTESEYKGINRNVLHNNEVYDTSVLNIIEKLSFSPKASLRPQDFAYLKNLGVFPNNRLMIARRFSQPQKDNIMDKGGSRPLAVLISWKPEDEDFIDFSFGEEWMDADADFTNVLNRLGENFGISGGGSGAGKGLNVVPLPGFTETIQRELLTKLGILENRSAGSDDTKVETSSQPLPSGNPNIIKIAKRRKTIGYGDAGSGLKATISIKMKVEYEQKFISGIDPTIAWMDIVNNALTFGTSNSSNYGLSKGFANKIKSWTGKGGVKLLINDIISALKSVLEEAKKKVGELVEGLFSPKKDGETSDDDLKKKRDAAEGALTKVLDLVLRSIEETIRKYQVELMGIAHSLTGLPSTPWHITIGNPLRPVFCSGDMLTDDVSLKMGPTLAFNDLPSNITVEFTLKNARPLGMQEILAKFNTGYLRVVNVRKDYLTSAIANDGNAYYETLQTSSTPVTGGGDSGSSQTNNTSNTNTTTKENG
jgi:hypothetical protein